MDNQSPPPDPSDLDVLEEVDLETAPSEADSAPEETVEASSLDAGSEVTAEDMDFIRRVFNQVKDVDFRTPPPPPPKNVSGPDKKLADLREMVRRLERDLARVRFVWVHKQEQVESVDAIVRDKEAERAHAVERYRQLKEHAKRAVASAKEEASAVRTLLGTLTTKKNELEETLARTQADAKQMEAELRERVARQEQEKAAMGADFRSKMEAAQAAFQQLRDQSTRTIGSLEAQLQARDESLAGVRVALKEQQTKVAERDTTVAELRQRVTELETRQQGMTEQVTAAEAKVIAREQTLTSLADKLTEREKTTAQLAEEMSRARSENEQRLTEMRAALKQTEDDLARVRADMQSQATEHKNTVQTLSADHKNALQNAQTEHKNALQSTQTEHKNALQSTQLEHKNELQAKATEYKNELDRKAAELKALQEQFDKRGEELERVKNRLATT